jgi:hypothetical protein
MSPHLLVAAAACLLSLPAHALPPPPERPPHEVKFTDDACAVRIEDAVRAYDFVSARFGGRAGDTLQLALAGDPGWHLRLQLRTPAGANIGLPRDAEGFIEDVRLPESGDYLLYMTMDGEQARVGRAIRFVLTLSRRAP